MKVTFEEFTNKHITEAVSDKAIADVLEELYYTMEDYTPKDIKDHDWSEVDGRVKDEIVKAAKTLIKHLG